MKAKPFNDLIERAKSRDRFWVESAILDFTEEILARMEHLDVSKSELANRLGKNPSFVTKLLRGNNNFTLETMVKLARKLDAEVRVHLQPDGTTSEWIDFLRTEPAREEVPAGTVWGGSKFKKIYEISAKNEQLALAS